MKLRRKVYEVGFDADEGVWYVRRRSRPRTRLAVTGTKAVAVERGMAIAKAAAHGGRRSQLVVRNMDGTFGYEHTYGADPRRHPS